MSQVVKIPVVEQKRPLKTIITNYVFWGIFMLFILLFILVDDPNNLIGKFFIAALTIFALGLVFIKEPYKVIGDLVIAETAIIFISNSNSKETYPIDKITDINLQYLGYQGRVRLFTLTFDSGLGNILSFKYLGVEFKFAVFLESKHVELLKNQIDYWKENKNIGLNDSSGEDLIL